MCELIHAHTHTHICTRSLLSMRTKRLSLLTTVTQGILGQFASTTTRSANKHHQTAQSNIVCVPIVCIETTYVSGPLPSPMLVITLNHIA